MFPLKNPTPDIDLMIDVLKGKRKTDQVMIAELIIDDEILEQFTKIYLKREWVPYDIKSFQKRRTYWDNVVECYYRLGYNSIRVSNGMQFNFNTLAGNDASDNSKKERKWSDHSGVIKTIEDFDQYPWPKIENFDLFDYQYVSSILPENMGITACVYGGILEMVCEYLVGFEEMSYMLFDDLELLEKIFEKVGDLLYQGYQKIIDFPRVKALFQGDDMGFSSGCLFDPKILKKYVLPWHKKLVDLAHSRGKYYFLHSCGNLRAIAADLIDLGIDAKHSYEDSGYSVIDFKRDYGKEVGIIGGVDVDKLTRYSEKELEKYCISILDVCTQGGRYVFGSGNSIANYVPLENFLTILKTARNYRIKL